MRAINALVAVVMVSALIGGAVLLFTQCMNSLAGPVGTPVRVGVKWNGLEMSMSVTPGPYFLGELLGVDLSLTNHTHQTLTLAGVTSPRGLCFPTAFSVQVSGGSPHYALFTMPVQFIMSCPARREGIGPTLAPGQTVTGHFYEPLTDSGDVTLTGEAFFYQVAINPQGQQGQYSGPHFP